MTLPKIRRIKKESDFKKIFSKGKTVRDSFLFIRYLKNNLEQSRLTVTVSAKVINKAVDRNKAKRRINSILGNKFDKIIKGYDIVFVVTKYIKNIGADKLKEEVVRVLNKAKLL